MLIFFWIWVILGELVLVILILYENYKFLEINILNKFHIGLSTQSNSLNSQLGWKKGTFNSKLLAAVSIKGDSLS